MPPLVSIIIPAFNSGKYLGDTVRSALAQTWPDKEIIIVDDGSSDDTLAVAKHFESREVKVLTQKNRGAAAARNAGLAVAQGDFIQWLDADDLLTPGKISLQLAGENAGREEILHSCAFATFYARPRQARRVANQLYQDFSPRDWLMTALTTGDWLPPQTWLVSRPLTERAGSWDERLSLNDDGEYFCRMVSLCSHIKCHPQTLCLYRTGNANSLSKAKSPKALNSLLLSVNLSIDYLFQLDKSGLAHKAALSFLQYCVDHFKIADPQIWQGFEKRARELGGELRLPAESWKLRAGRALLGETGAARVRVGVERTKWAAFRQREKICSWLGHAAGN